MILGEHKKYIVNFNLPINGSSMVVSLILYRELTDNVHIIYNLACNCLVD
jgi:hypothetical protein